MARFLSRFVAPVQGLFTQEYLSRASVALRTDVTRMAVGPVGRALGHRDFVRERLPQLKYQNQHVDFEISPSCADAVELHFGGCCSGWVVLYRPVSASPVSDVWCASGRPHRIAPDGGAKRA